jgi:opacity protein-like surface antigen
MKPIVIGALLLCSTSASAQSNRLSLGLNVFGQSNYETHSSTTSQFGSAKSDLKTTTFLLVPSIGYYRMIGKTVGVGLELGYGQNRSTSSRVETYSNEQVSTQRSEADYKLYYICPSLFEMFSSQNGKYRFITSAAIPVSYSPKTSSMQEQLQYNPVTAIITTQSRIISAPDTRLEIGIFVNGSVQRRIAGNLFFGPQLGVGVNNSRIKTDGNVVYLQRPGSSTERRSETPVNNLSSSFNFQIRPTLSLNYFF